MNGIIDQAVRSARWWWAGIQWAGRNINDIIFWAFLGVVAFIVVFGMVNATRNHIELAIYHNANASGDVWASVFRTLFAWGLVALLAWAVIAWL